MSQPNTPFWKRIASWLVRNYVKWIPLARGKYRLLRAAGRFLIVPTKSNIWLRVSGVSGFETKALSGEVGERRTLDAFRSLLRPGMVVFDVGANVGYYALTAAGFVGTAGGVFAFEATPKVALRLEENVALNGLQNVTVIHSAVCDRPGTVDLRLQDDDSEGNSLVSFADTWERVSVPSITLDGFVAERKIATVDVLKIDVEGAEPMVLRGASRMLTTPGRPVVIMEVNPIALRAGGATEDALLSQLAQFGYYCRRLETLTNDAEPTWNVIAHHPEHLVAGFDVELGSPLDLSVVSAK